MNPKPNKFIGVAYRLYTIEGGNRKLEEEAPADLPYQFISGFGITLDDFEKAIVDLEAHQPFELHLTPEQAYGAYEEERVIELDKNIFSVDGEFDSRNIFKGAIVPLQNEDGNRFMAQVLDINDSTVKVDLNHPLAGKELLFEGHIVESREATNEEIAAMINQMSGNGCSCGGCQGGGCGGDCNHGQENHRCHCQN